ncbi:winged helix-turn-helix transcriptional regulator, partial [bacterium]|nr:winged helix-turn-helix transcriptional regulator [bacterium]
MTLPATNRPPPNPKSRDLDLTLVACLSRLDQALDKVMREAGRKERLSPEQARIILYLRRARPGIATVKDLALTFMVGHPTISASVRSLVQRGLVSRQPIGPGRRSRLDLTAEGDATALRFSACAGQVVESVSALDHEVKVSLLSGLLRLLRSLQGKGAVPPPRLCLNCIHFQPHVFGDVDAPHRCDDYGVA